MIYPRIIGALCEDAGIPSMGHLSASIEKYIVYKITKQKHQINNSEIPYFMRPAQRVDEGGRR
jgi:hypothetical protein